MRKLLLGVIFALLTACSATTATPPHHSMIFPVVPTQTRKVVRTTDPNQLSSLWINGPSEGTHCIPDANGNATNSQVHTDWKNNTNTTMDVTYHWVWIGADSAGSAVLGGVADDSYLLQNITTGDILAWNNWDRYANPTSLNSDIDKTSYAQGYVAIHPGDTVRFSFGCAGPYEPYDMYPISIGGMAVLMYLSR